MPAKRLEVSDDMTPFAKRLVSICIEQNISLKMLCERTEDLPKSTVYEIVDKRREPTIPTINKICEALKMSYIDFFIGMEGNLETEYGTPHRLEMWTIQQQMSEKQISMALELMQEVLDKKA